MRVFSEKFNQLMFTEINSLPAELFAKECGPGGDLSVIAEQVSARLCARLGLGAEDRRELDIARNRNKTTAMFTRLPAFISACCSLEAEAASGEKMTLLEAGRAHMLAGEFQPQKMKQEK